MASFTATPHTDDLDGALAALAVILPRLHARRPQWPDADGYFTGRREDLTNCPGGLRTTVVAANAGDRADVTALMTVATAGSTDDVALNIVLDSFYFTTPDGSASATTVAAVRDHVRRRAGHDHGRRRAGHDDGRRAHPEALGRAGAPG